MYAQEAVIELESLRAGCRTVPHGLWSSVKHVRGPWDSPPTTAYLNPLAPFLFSNVLKTGTWHFT